MSVAAPPSEALAWAAAAAGPGANVVGARRLTGGIMSAVHEVCIADAGGRRRWFVMRRFLRPDPYRPDAVAIEARVLRDLEATDVPAPRVVAVDTSGDDAGAPALLLHRLPGRLELRPDCVHDYVEQMAALLARIHRGPDIDAPAALSWVPGTKDASAWSKRPELWEEVGQVLAQPAPQRPVRFIHGDFQHFNMLWSGARLTGVVDWSLAMRGPPDRDVSHCRLNLACLHGPEPAERFRMAWEAETGWALDPWWDLGVLNAWGPSWPTFLPRQVGRRIRVDWSTIHDRVEALVELALRRV